MQRSKCKGPEVGKNFSAFKEALRKAMGQGVEISGRQGQELGTLEWCGINLEKLAGRVLRTMSWGGI